MTCTSLDEIHDRLLDGLVFCASVYELFESVRNSEDGRARLRMRRGDTAKKLLEELLPICRYVQANYRAGRYISVRWVNGNQQYDAEIQQWGGYVEHSRVPSNAHLEVTCVMHPNDYLVRELLDEGGVAFAVEETRRDKKKARKIDSTPLLRGNEDFIDSYVPLVTAQLKKKVGINYPEKTTLVVQCSLNTLYMADEWERLIGKVRSDMPKHGFLEVFMYDAVSEQYAYL
jgi:hypothetical protein